MDTTEAHTEKHKHHDTWKIIVAGLFTLLAGVVVFGAGVLTGLEKARFSEHWQANYYPNVVGMPGSGKQPPIFNAHGVVGSVIKLDPGSLVIEDKDGSEKTVLVTPASTIREDGGTITFSQLRLGDQVVVIGSPNDRGEVTATLVRVMEVGEQ